MVFKNRYLIMLFSAVILVVNFALFFKAVKLLYLFVVLLFTTPAKVIAVLNLNVVDILCSSVLIILILAGSIFLKIPKVLDRKVNMLSFFSILLLFFFTVPSLIADTPPEYYSNITLTKLLKPFSAVYYSRVQSSNTDDHFSAFLNLKEELLRTNFKSEGMYKENDTPGSALTNRKVFIFGSDEYGRDIASRVIYGTRISFITGFLAVGVSLLLGLVIGFLSGYAGGITDIILNRIVEMLLSFPMIFLIILFAALFGSSLITIIFLLGFTGWMTLFKIVRGEIILLKKKEYFISSKLLGSNMLLLLKECMPAISMLILLNLIFQFSNVILAESALNYLGLGAGTSYPSWGSMIQEGQSYIYKAWWMILLPGIFLIASLSIINTIGRNFTANDKPRMEV